MAITSKFHAKVLSSKAFSDNMISQVIDEGHCIPEWGNDDFRPEFSQLHLLLARLPSGLPVVVGSATMPRDVILDIKLKLRLRSDCAQVSVSNAKPNIALSVRIMQHPQDTFADLMTLLPRDLTVPSEIPQTLIYASGRMEVEKMQDFFRHNKPEHIDPAVFEFYHRFIAEDRKASLQELIESEALRIGAATDALGMVRLRGSTLFDTDRGYKEWIFDESCGLCCGTYHSPFYPLYRKLGAVSGRLSFSARLSFTSLEPPTSVTRLSLRS
jgi:superfamily II DNA helicase RecQ